MSAYGCPACGKTVKAGEMTCRYCGADLSADPRAHAAVPKSRGRFTIVALVVAGVIALGLIGVVVFVAVVMDLSSATGSRSTGSSTRAARTADAPAAAVSVIANAIDSGSKLGIVSGDLEAMANPKGAGTFVYVSQTRFSGVERYLVWLVLDGEGYALNGPSKMVTPGLPWPSEADESTWAATGLDRFGATKALEIVFGER